MYSYAVEKPLSMGHKSAGYLPSLFWGFITLGRLFSIPISSRVNPASMVFVNVVSQHPWLSAAQDWTPSWQECGQEWKMLGEEAVHCPGSS